MRGRPQIEAVWLALWAVRTQQALTFPKAQPLRTATTRIFTHHPYFARFTPATELAQP